MIKDRPHRLDRIFSRAPLYFVTFCARNRQKIDDLRRLAAAFRDYCTRAAGKHNVAVGRYVIIPDHVHFFVRGDPDFLLSSWVGGLKRAMSVAVLNESQATSPLLHKSTRKEMFCRSSRAGCGSSHATRVPTHAPLKGKNPVEAAVSAAVSAASQATRLSLHRKSLWQPGFFDHVLRNDESYAQKWEYVRENPVRAGLVSEWHEWPYQGEIVLIDRA